MSTTIPALRSNQEVNHHDELKIGGVTFPSRLLMGSGRFDSLEIMRDALSASGTGLVTFAIRRERLHDAGGRNLIDFLELERYQLLPNTSGCFDAESAVRCARMGREILRSLGSGTQDFVKLEVLGDSKTLLPDPISTVQAAEQLVSEGFQVLCYVTDDPILSRRLFQAGVAAVMPAGSPIGSGMGVVNPIHIRAIVDDLKGRNSEFPIIVDAGIGTASDAVRAMELGVDAVLLNSAVAKAKSPVLMAKAMKNAVIAGRDAFAAGRMTASRFASASSPEFGLIGGKSG
ncbi:MAG: thiazole synthase [Pirellulaceae bacterium]